MTTAFYLGGLIRRVNGPIINGDTIFVLPPSYRPDKRILTKGYQNETPIRLNIETDGVVRVLSDPDPSRDWISLEGIHFNRELMVGDFHQGGYVFYIADPPADLNGDGIPDKGLMAAPMDQGLAEWGCYGTITGASNTTVGSGQTNTNIILQNCAMPNIAAKICDDLVLNGYDDWFLPSEDEAQLMWQNLADSDGDDINTGPTDPNNIGGFINNVYLTSTESSFNQWNLMRLISMQNGIIENNTKNFTVYVRAIRVF